MFGEKYNFFWLHISIIRLDAETGKAKVAPCSIAPQYMIDLENFLQDVVETDERNIPAFIQALRLNLGMIYEQFKSPLSYKVVGMTFESNNLNPPPFDQPILVSQEESKMFAYDPERMPIEFAPASDFLREFSFKSMSHNN